MKKKALIILPDLRIGGAEKNSVLIANELYKNGMDVVFVLKNNSNSYSYLLNANIKIISINVKKLRTIILPLAKIINKEKPQIIVSSMWPLTSLSLISLFISRVRSKIYFIEHVPLFISRNYETKSSKFMMKSLINLTYGFANKIICVSKGIRKEIIRETYINKNKIEVIYNPIIESKKKTFQRYNYWKDLKSKKILTVGSLKFAKNHELLINSFNILNSKMNCELIIIGEGPLKNNLIELVSKLNLNSKIQILKYQNDISFFYNTADVFVLTSRWEGFGNVIVESLSYGTPVVSVDCPYGPAEILCDNSLGNLVSSNDPEKISESIINCLSKKIDKKKLIDYSENYSVYKQVNRYLKVFNVK